MFCIPLLHLPGGISLQSGVRTDFAVVTAKLLSQAPQPLELTQLAGNIITEDSGEATASGPPDWTVNIQDNMSPWVGLNIHWVLLSFMRLYDSSRAKIYSGSYFWFSVRLTTWWLRQKKRNSILYYRKTIQSFQDCRWQYWSSNSIAVHISDISHPHVWQAMMGEDKPPLSVWGHQSLKANKDTSPLKLKIRKLLSLTEAAGDATGRKAALEEEIVLLSYYL